jgi:hypothetical protein
VFALSLTGTPALAIYGGTPATGDTVVVGLLRSQSGTTSGCSGALVAPRVVMTASHCLTGNVQNVWIPEPGTDLRDLTTKRIQAEKFFIPESFSMSVFPYQNDFGIIILKSAFPNVKTLEIAEEVISAGASHIGFVLFPKSPRNISPRAAGEIVNKIKDRIQTVIVTVNPTDELISETLLYFKPDYIQLHGHEMPTRAKEIMEKFDLKIIKAIAIKNKPDLQEAERYKKLVDYIARQRKMFPKEDVAENFADGKGPGRPGDSQRHGIPKGASIAQLEKAAKAPGRKGQLARWQLNMRRGKAKTK